MKKNFLAALVGTCCASSALAQSSIQIYGIADAGVLWQRGGPTKIVSGGADGSRLGFKGVEDIGNGFKAVFNLEARVELDTGSQVPTLINDNQGFFLTRGMQALPAPILAAVRTALQPPGMPAVNPNRALFDRTSMVGMVTPLGAILIGRMYTPGYEVFAAADTFEIGTVGTWGNVAQGTAGFTALGADIRSDKSIQYRVAHPSGFGGSLMYGRGGAGYYGRYKEFWGAAITYKANGWDVGVGHNHGYDQDGLPSLKTTTVGGSYTLGPYKLFAGFHDQRNHHSALLRDYIGGWDALIAPQLAPLGAPTATALRTVFVTNIFANTQQFASSYQFGLQYRIGPGRLMASVAYQNDRTASDSDATQFALGYFHNMSKRTDLYMAASFIRNLREAQYSPGIAGTPGGFTRSPGEDGRAFQIGVRHRF
jgi:predicted porin